MAARAIKSSSPALDMKALIALDGIHKAQPEQELLEWDNILCWRCSTGSVHPCQARRSSAHRDLSSLQQIPFSRKGRAASGGTGNIFKWKKNKVNQTHRSFAPTTILARGIQEEEKSIDLLSKDCNYFNCT